MSNYWLPIQKIWTDAPLCIPWLITGLCLGIGFLIPTLWFVATLGILLFLDGVEKGTSLRAVLAGGFIAWTVKSLCAIGWFWYVFPFDAWLSVGGAVTQILIIIISWVIPSLALGLGGLVLAGILWRLNLATTTRPFLRLSVLPFLWVFAELFGSVLFSVITAGPGSFIQPYFSFGYLGYLFGLSGLGIWCARIGGVYGLSMIFVGLTGLGMYFTNRTRIIYGGIMLGLFSISMVVSFQTPFIPTKGITIATIDTSFSAARLTAPGGYEYKSAALKSAVEAALALQSDFVLLPEDSRYLQLVYSAPSNDGSLALFRFLHSTTTTLIIDSGRAELVTGKRIERAQLFSGADQRVYTYDKQYLVPQGEFIPYLFRMMLRLSGAPASILDRPTVGRYEPGPLTQTGTIDPQVPGILFCFESAQPNGVRNLMTNRTTPNFIVHPVSHAWFHNPTVLSRQLGVMLQIQARWQQIPIVSAGNMATGKTYLPDGTILQEPVVASGEGWGVRLVRL